MYRKNRAFTLRKTLCKKLFCHVRRSSFHKSGKCFVDSGKTLRRIQKENICRRIPLIKLERIFGIHSELLRKYGKDWNTFLTFLDNCKTLEYKPSSIIVCFYNSSEAFESLQCFYSIPRLDPSSKEIYWASRQCESRSPSPSS